MLEWTNQDFTSGNFQSWAINPFASASTVEAINQRAGAEGHDGAAESSSAMGPMVIPEGGETYPGGMKRSRGIEAVESAQSSFSSTDEGDITGQSVPSFTGGLQSEQDTWTSTLPASLYNPSLRRGMACAFCRRRKLRCTGEKPRCANCIKYGKECEYVPTVKATRRESDQRSFNDQANQSGASSSLLTAFSSHPLPSPSHPAYPTHPPPPPTHRSHSGTYEPSFYSMRDDQNEFTNPGLTTLEDPERSYNHSPHGPPRGYTTSPHGLPPSHVSPSQVHPHQHSEYNWGHPSPMTPYGPTSIQTPTLPTHYTPTIPSQSTPIHYCNYPYPITPGLPSSSSQSHPYMTDPQQRYNPPPWPTHLSTPTTNQTSPSDSSPRKCDEVALPLASTLNLASPSVAGKILPSPGSMHHSLIPDTTKLIHAPHEDAIAGLTERLGEFLFSPTESMTRRGRGRSAAAGGSQRPADPLARAAQETDGLGDEEREILLDCFLSHSRLFFEMHIPRFRQRLAFADHRRPGLALLNAMYLWATRLSNKSALVQREQHFFTAGCHALSLSSADGDRLIDCLRAAMLLSTYSWVSGRFHEGWILAGMAVRLVLSTGLHQITSCVFEPPAPKNEFLRNKVYLLPPPEDATELAERIHTFWGVFIVDRTGASATGFPSGLRDEDIRTPFPRPIPEYTSGIVSIRANVTVRDLYRYNYPTPADNYTYDLWIRGVSIFERATKLAFLDPEEDSQHSTAWRQYTLNIQLDTLTPAPPGWLEQPQYRCPRAYRETKLGLEQLVAGMGIEGVFPVDRRREGGAEGGGEEIFVAPHTIMLHHQFAATHMLLHDVNSMEHENTEALIGPRRGLALMKYMPPIAVEQVDSFCLMVWVIMAKVLVKEMHRLDLIGDIQGNRAVEAEADDFIREMRRIGSIMQLARTQAKALDDLKEKSKAIARGEVGVTF